MAAYLALVRHGETTWVAEDRFQGRQDPPLSERGQRQAALVAEQLAGVDRRLAIPLPSGPPAAIWHSPLQRAAATAEAIAARLRDVPLVPSDALLEIAAGEWEGRLNADVAARDGERLAAWRSDPTRASAPGGEPLLDVAARVRAGLRDVLKDLARADGGEPWAVVVAHDGVLRLVLLSLLGVPYERFWSFPFALCAITVVEVRDGGTALRAHNLADHLAPLVADRTAAEEARGDRTGAL